MILLSLVERLKSSEAKMSTQAEVHKAEVQELEKKLAEAIANFNVELTKHEYIILNAQGYIKMLKSSIMLRKSAIMLLQNVLRI
jgi:predicted RNase H-like nuclease (RuvC/YqgF family)